MGFGCKRGLFSGGILAGLMERKKGFSRFSRWVGRGNKKGREEKGLSVTAAPDGIIF